MWEISSTGSRRRVSTVFNRSPKPSANLENAESEATDDPVAKDRALPSDLASSKHISAQYTQSSSIPLELRAWQFPGLVTAPATPSDLHSQPEGLVIPASQEELQYFVTEQRRPGFTLLSNNSPSCILVSKKALSIWLTILTFSRVWIWTIASIEIMKPEFYKMARWRVKGLEQAPIILQSHQRKSGAHRFTPDVLRSRK